MQSPLHTRSRTEREDVVEIEPPHSVASQLTVQQLPPVVALPAATPSTPVARKRQRAEPAEPRIVKFVVGKFRPSDLKDIENAKKRLAKPQTQEALQHKEIMYLHRRLKAYKGARKEVWKVAKGLFRVPVERGWTPSPELLVAKMKGQVQDSLAVGENRDDWPSSFAKLERQWDDIYLAEFPEVTAAPRWGTPSWTSFLTAFSRQFIARPSARALGGLLAPRARHDEEDSDEVVEARPALPTPASSGVSADLEGSAELSPLPAPRAPGSSRAAPQTAPTSPAAPLPGEPAGQRPLEPLSPATVVAFNLLGTLAAQGWDCMATRCVWWTRAAARDYRTARENFEYRLQELQWVNSLSRTVATAHAVLTSPSHGQSSAEALVDQLRREQLGGPAVTEDQVERLVGFWLSSADRLGALVGPGHTSLREFLNGVYRAGQALLGMTVASTVPSRPVDAPAAPHEPSASAPTAGAGRPSNFPSTPEQATRLPPLPDLGTEEFR
ncbi:hypothetical protein Emag_007694 [Eimeria magna]